MKALLLAIAAAGSMLVTVQAMADDAAAQALAAPVLSFIAVIAG